MLDWFTQHPTCLKFSCSFFLKSEEFLSTIYTHTHVHTKSKAFNWSLAQNDSANEKYFPQKWQATKLKLEYLQNICVQHGVQSLHRSTVSRSFSTGIALAITRLTWFLPVGSPEGHGVPYQKQIQHKDYLRKCIQSCSCMQNTRIVTMTSP